MQGMRISAKADYAVRAALELALAEGRLLTCEAVARTQDIPQKFLESILSDLRHAGLVRSQRGVDGGYTLARSAHTITVADVIRAVDGPLASVRGQRPQDVHYDGSAAVLRSLWVAVRASLREVLEGVSLADLAAGQLPAGTRRLTEAEGAWVTR